MLDGALEQQRKDCDGDVGMNTVGYPVEYRAHLQPTLHRPPGFFHPLLLFVAQRHVFGRQRVVVAMHDKFSVESFQFGHCLTIDRQTPFRFLQQAPVASTGAQRANPFRVAHSGKIGQAGQFCLQFVQQFLAMRLLALGFQRIEADRIAPPPLTLADGTIAARAR